MQIEILKRPGTTICAWEKFYVNKQRNNKINYDKNHRVFVLELCFLQAK